jgi:hypothetical protein
MQQAPNITRAATGLLNDLVNAVQDPDGLIARRGWGLEQRHGPGGFIEEQQVGKRSANVNSEPTAHFKPRFRPDPRHPVIRPALVSSKPLRPAASPLGEAHHYPRMIIGQLVQGVELARRSAEFLTRARIGLPSPRNRAKAEGRMMADDSGKSARARFWMTLAALVILLIFLYFYKPFESYLTSHIPEIHFSNVIFWFAALTGVVGYVLAHWQSLRRQLFRPVKELNVEDLVFETVQAAIMVAVIFTAGAMLQSVVILGQFLVNTEPSPDGAMSERLLTIVLLLILSILLILLHAVVRAFRGGWSDQRRPPRSSNSGPASG